MNPLKSGKNLVANDRPRACGIGISRILANGQAGGTAKLRQLVSRHAKKRTRQDEITLQRTNRRHAGQPGRAAAPGQAKQHCFSLVIRLVCGDHRDRINFTRHLRQGCISGIPRRGGNTMFPSTHIHPTLTTGQLQALSQLLHPPGVGIRTSPQPVVDMTDHRIDHRGRSTLRERRGQNRQGG